MKLTNIKQTYSTNMNQHSDSKIILTNFLPYVLVNLAKQTSDVFSRTYKREFGITVAEWRVIAWVALDGTLTASQICKLSTMDKVKVSRAIKLLRDKELIIETPDEQDNRVKHISFTEKGKALYAGIVPKAQRWEGELLKVLSAGEYRDLMNIFDKLTAQLELLEKQGLN